MPLTLEDIPLTSDPRLEEEALSMLDPTEAPEWGSSTWPGRAFLGTPWGPYRHPSPAPEVGTLHWPAWGLSRHAFGHFIVHATTAARLVAIASGKLGGIEGDTDSEDAPPRLDEAALTLEMKAESQTTMAGNSDVLQFQVYLLPPRPIIRPTPAPQVVGGLGTVVTSGGPHLITVVDRRYYLRSRTARHDLDLEVECGATWESLLGALAEDARIALEVEKPDDGYYVPPKSLATLAGQDVARAIDAVAACIGQRVVARYDGTFFTQSAPEAKLARDTDDTRAGSNRRRRLGGGDQYPEIY